MAAAKLNLVVLRVADIDRSSAFYRALGIAFEKHAHGGGPVHLANEENGLVFELYPATREQPVSTSTRLGFVVTDVDHLVTSLASQTGVRIFVSPTDSEWGRRAVVADPDGHRVELVEVKRSRNGASGGSG